MGVKTYYLVLWLFMPDYAVPFYSNPKSRSLHPSVNLQVLPASGQAYSFRLLTPGNNYEWLPSL
jgi:hypothetical protein